MPLINSLVVFVVYGNFSVNWSLFLSFLFVYVVCVFLLMLVCGESVCARSCVCISVSPFSLM